MTKSFTLLELIIVIVVIGIVAAVAAGSAVDLTGARSTQAGHKIRSDIRFAQSYAIASQKKTRVFFNTTGDTYSIYYFDQASGGWILMITPYSRSNFTVSFNQGEYAGVDINQVDFGGYGASLVFDKKGIPYGSDGISNTTLASGGSITLGTGMSVLVEPVTGKAAIQ